MSQGAHVYAQVAQAGGNSVMDAIRDLVADGANNALQGVLDLLNRSHTSLGISQDWFGSQYDMMLAMGAWVMLPLIALSVIQSIAKSSMDQLIKSVLFYPLIATAGAVVAVEIVRMLIVIVDDLSALFNNSASGQIDQFFTQVKAGFEFNAPQDAAQGSVGGEIESGARTIFVLLIGVGIMLASLMTVVILGIRDATIYLATVFLPIGFATLVWPASRKWLRTIAEFLLAMIMSKLVIVATISLGVSAAVVAVGPEATGPTLAVDGSTVAGAATTAAAGGGDDTFQFVYLSLFVLALLIFAIWSPNASQRMISLALDGAAGAFAANSGKPSFYKWLMAYDRWRNNIAGSFRSARDTKEKYRQKTALVADQSVPNERLLDMGHGGKSGADGYDYRLTDEELAVVTAGARDEGTGVNHTAAAMRDNLRALSASTNANDVAMAREIYEAYQTGAQVTYNSADGWVSAMHTRQHNGTGPVQTYRDTVVVISPVDAAGRTVTELNQSDVRAQVASARAHNVANATPGSTTERDRVRVKGGLDVNRPADRQMLNTIDSVVGEMRQSDALAQGPRPRRTYVHQAERQLDQQRTIYQPSADFNPTT